MNNAKAKCFPKQAENDTDGKLFFYEDLPDEKLDKTLPLDLVGYALSIIRLSNKRKSLRLNLPNTYLSKLWGCSAATTNRKLKLLQEHRIIMRMTSNGEKSCDGSFYRTRVIFVRPTHRAHNPTPYPVEHLSFNQMTPNIDLLTSNQLSIEDTSKSKLIIHKTTNPKDLDRTLQGEIKKQSSNNFISTKELKEIPSKNKRHPSKKIKSLQKTFLKQAIDKIDEMEVLDYRFMCLMLRQVLGAENPSIAHYGTKLHLILRHKPELIVCALGSMVNSMDTIRCPIGWFVAEIQSLSGFRDFIVPQEKEKKIDQAIPKISKEGQRFMERMKLVEVVK